MKWASPLLCRALGLVIVVVVACLRPSAARAYEDQATVGLSLGYANAVFKGQPAPGAAAILHGSLGLGDIWSVRAQLGYGFHPDHTPLSVLMAGADLIYTIDVLEWVPYFGAGIDALSTLRARAVGAEAGLHAALGLDWLCSRSFGFELEARPVFLLTALGRDPVYFTLTLSGLLFLDL
ncbi:MAG TPA: hypothetical protein VF331_01480 [Polyangiales bacterium]